MPDADSGAADPRLHFTIRSAPPNMISYTVSNARARTLSSSSSSSSSSSAVLNRLCGTVDLLVRAAVVLVVAAVGFLARNGASSEDTASLLLLLPPPPVPSGDAGAGAAGFRTSLPGASPVAYGLATRGLHGSLHLLTERARALVVETEWYFLLPACAFLLFLAQRRFYIEESLLVVRSMGIQTSTSSSSYLAGPTIRFIPTAQVQDIFVHEAFRGFEVRYYLAIVVKGEKEVTVAFPNLLPKLKVVEEVWRGARACLFDYKALKSD